ncbi:MAG: hypothetical protein NZM42_02320, partial [Gemmatales bacterium]|nr:hypothetical protein [Gemmatales bacterium]
MSEIQNNRVEPPAVAESEAAEEDNVITDVYKSREETLEGAGESEAAVSDDMPRLSLQQRVSQLEEVCEDLGQRVLRLESEFSKTRETRQDLRSQPPDPDIQGHVRAARSSWLVVEIGRDLIWTWHMFRDVRYQVSWTTIFLGLTALVYLTIWPAVRSWIGWGWSIPIIS